MKYYAKALDIAEAIDDKMLRVKPIWGLDAICYYLKDREKNPKRAIKYYEMVADTAKAIGAKPVEASYYISLGAAYLRLRDPEEAIKYFVKALEIAKALRDHPEEVRAYIGLGFAYENLGDSERAIEYYEKALEIGNGIYV